jgi:hypothetical protein
MVNTRKGRTIRQQQTEMNPPNPPPARTDPVVAAQMLVLQQMTEVLQQMTDVVNEMQNQIRQERQDQLKMHQEMRQARLER